MRFSLSLTLKVGVSGEKDGNAEFNDEIGTRQILIIKVILSLWRR